MTISENAFEKWMLDNGFMWDMIRIVRDEGNAYIKATSDIPSGTVICRIIKSSILSVRNSSIADQLEEYRGGMALAVVMCIEKQNPDSKWKPYFESLETRNVRLPDQRRKNNTTNSTHPDQTCGASFRLLIIEQLITR
jgi:hypothetical protein